MATYTTNLNLEKPATSENFDLLKINANWDKIDSYAGTVNSNSFTQLDFTTTFKNYIGSNYDVYCVKYGKVCIVSGYFNISTVPTNNNIEIVNTGLSVYREAFFPFNDSDGYSVRSKIATSGKITNEALFAHTGWHTFSCIFIVN